MITANSQALDASIVEKDIACHVKKAFDKEYDGVWHCIVGKQYGKWKDSSWIVNLYSISMTFLFAAAGSFVSHEAGNFIYLYVRGLAVLLFKSG